MTFASTPGLPVGVHTGFPAEQYHADPAELPSLSASIACTLVQKSPAHARVEHPRLNPYLVREEKKAFDLGTTVHALLLEQRAPEDVIHIVEKDDWRTNEAKDQAKYAREMGLIPLLDKDNEDVLTMVAAARRQIREFDAAPPLLADGHAEATLVWQEDGVTCRSRLDWLRDDCMAIDDVKTTSRIGGANQREFERGLYQHGYDVKAAFYLRGVKALSGVDAEFRWIVIETAAPYALSVVRPGPDVLALGADKVEYALRVWKQCVQLDEWPAYGNRIATAEMPAWAEMQWLERSAV